MSQPPTPPTNDAAPIRRCQNCGEVLLGEHCYACGQPTKGLVRQFSTIIGDFMDSVFELDSRILRTLGPLLFRPGFLSTEYFAGRRVRYVSPVRLFVFLSLFAFFAAQWTFDIGADESGESPVQINTAPGQNRQLASATTVEEVESIRDQALAQLATARADAGTVPGVGVAMEVAEQGVRAEAERRIQAIERAQETGEPLPVARDNEGRISFNGTPWDAASNPIHIPWLPAALNRKLNESAGRAQGNIERIQDDPNLLKDAFLSTVPATLFVLLPLFAVLLKVAYVFKKRLYMEHLIIALHSHSFLCGALLLVMLLGAITGWTAGWPWLSGLFYWLEIALLVWMPLYLLLMQKRVYGQGWPMTLIKFFIIGNCYMFLLSIGAAINVMVSLVNL
jgi:hypothetical protein